MSDQKHAELPWELSYDGRTIGPVKYVHTVQPRVGETKANAEFIVRACNSHYELLAALELCERHIIQLTNMVGSQFDKSILDAASAAKPILDAASAAIAKAKGITTP